MILPPKSRDGAKVVVHQADGKTIKLTYQSSDDAPVILNVKFGRNGKIEVLKMDTDDEEMHLFLYRWICGVTFNIEDIPIKSKKDKRLQDALHCWSLIDHVANKLSEVRKKPFYQLRWIFLYSSCIELAEWNQMCGLERAYK